MDIHIMALNILGYPIKEAQRKLIDIQNCVDIESFQDNMKWEIYNYHKNNNNFYSKIVNNKSVRDWNDVPVITKKNYQLPLKNLLSNGFTKKNTHIHNTSGSTGIPFFFC